MNLHGIASPCVGAVNPLIPVAVRISTGVASTSPSGNRQPGYATPGALTGAIGGGVLTVSAVSQGLLMPGQTVAGAGVPPGVDILAQLSGTPGGAGAYQLNDTAVAVGSEAMTTALNLIGQVQPISTRDLAQLEGINLGGVRWKIYLNGQVDAIVRPEPKGGDLIIIATGRHQGTWLVVQVMEQWPDWCVAAIVQQNGG